MWGPRRSPSSSATSENRARRGSSASVWRPQPGFLAESSTTSSRPRSHRYRCREGRAAVRHAHLERRRRHFRAPHLVAEQPRNHRHPRPHPTRSREDDRSRVLDSAGQIAIPTNRQVIHVRAPWLLDRGHRTGERPGRHVWRPPRLRSRTSSPAAVSAIQNLTKCVEGAGVQVDDIVLESHRLARRAVLEEQERQQGVALVDIGGSTTSIAVYDEGSIAHTACLPIAGSQLTNDLARVLRCPWEAAEQLKITVGAAYADAAIHDTVEIQAFGTQAKKTVDARHVCEILQARAEEILDMVARRTEACRLLRPARRWACAHRRHQPAARIPGGRGSAGLNITGPARTAERLFRPLRPDRDASLLHLYRPCRVRPRRS